jgi:excisionase family DNA binding protein
MDKPRRKRALGDFTLAEEGLDYTPEDRQHLEESLRILASLIASAVMRRRLAQVCSERNGDSEEESPTASVVGQQQEKLGLSVTEAAKLLGVGRSATYEAVRTGQIPSIRIGRRIIIPRAALLNMLKKAGVEKAGGVP